MGAGNLDHRELHQLMKLRTGAMSLSTHVTNHHSEMNAFEQVKLPRENIENCLNRSELVIGRKVMGSFSN